jgi:hypothetical protein
MCFQWYWVSLINVSECKFGLIVRYCQNIILPKQISQLRNKLSVQERENAYNLYDATQASFKIPPTTA